MLLSLLSSLFSLLLCWVRKAFFVSNIFGKKKTKADLIPQGKGIISESVFVGCMWILKVIKIESFTRVRFFFLLPSLPFSFFLLFSFLPPPFLPNSCYTDHRSHCPFNRKFQLLFFLISPIPSESWKTILSLISSPSPINVFDWLRKLSIVVETIMHSPS